MNPITSYIPNINLGFKNQISHQVSTCMRNHITPLRLLGAAGVLLVIATLARTWMASKQREADRAWGQTAIKGTVYIQDTTGGPLGTDKFFGYRNRISKADGSPLEIPRNDLLICFDGQFTKGKEDLLKKDGKVIRSSILLPSCLFNNIDNGGKVRFRLDNRLAKLRVDQTLRKGKSAQPSFQDTLKMTKQKIYESKRPAAYIEDRREEYTNALKLGPLNVGLQRVSSQHSDQSGIPPKLMELAQDQAKGGAYRILSKVGPSGDQIEVYVGCSLEDADILSFAFLNEFWVVIPHKLEHNQWPSGVSSMNLSDEQGLRNVLREDFSPSKDHLPGYVWGKCLMLTVNPLDNWQVKRSQCRNYIRLEREKRAEEL